jgi:hypothetical protein
LSDGRGLSTVRSDEVVQPLGRACRRHCARVECRAPPAATATPTATAAATPTATPTATATATATPTNDTEFPRPSKALTFGIGGGAIACLLTGIIVGAIAKSRSDEQEGDVGNPPLYTPELQGRGKTGESMATGAYVMFGIGGALAVADVVLLIERFRPHRKKAQARAVSVKPSPVGLSVTF